MPVDRQALQRSIRVFVALLIVASILSGVSLGASAQKQQQSTQEIEPNDAPKGGTPIVGGQINGSLDPAQIDWDWYVVRAEQGETIEATMNFETVGNADFEMRLESSNGTELDTADESSPQVGVAATAPETSLYYIGITSFYSRDEAASPNTLPYTLTASPVMNSTPPSFTGSPTLSDQPRSASEPNNDRDSAIRPQGAPIAGTMSSDNDTDWFAVDAEAGERIEVLVEFERFSNNSYMRMNMYGPEGYIGPFEPSQTDRRAQMATIAEYSGTYYFKLWPNRPPEDVNYTVTMFSVGEQGNGTASTTQRTATPAGPSSTSTSDTPTVTVSETNATVNYPPGYAASGITDPLRAASQHRSTLSESSSYTITRNRSTILRTQTLHQNTTLRINTTANRALTYENTSGGGNEPVVSEIYHTDNAAYERTTALFEKAPMYSANPTRFSAFANRSFPSVEQFLLSANYGSAQLVVRNGETLIRYKATESTGRPIFGFVSSENMNNASGFNATILVDQNGVVQSLSFSVTYRGEDGNLRRKQLDRRITGFNTTTIRKPSWLAEAKANTSIQTTATPTERPTQTLTVTQTTTTEPPTTTPNMTTTMMLTTTSPDSPTGDTTTTNGTVTSGATAGGNTTGRSGTSGPGFGPMVAVVALLTGALFVARRRTE